MSKTKEEKELKQVRKVEGYVKDLRRDMDKRFSDLRKQMGPVRHRAEETISERPLLVVSVALLVGVALGVSFGVALSKSKD
ncbi:MAG: hypothetical protein ABSA92_16360 [Candidatus Bathyarchaeia archaeon]